MTFGRVAEALPRAIRLVGWPKLCLGTLSLFLAYGLGQRNDTVTYRLP